MRFAMGFLLALGFTATLFAQTDKNLNETDLARKYYEAAKSSDQRAAKNFLKKLQERFPDSPLTGLVNEHREARDQNADRLTMRVYEVADLIVPIGEQDRAAANKLSKENAVELIELIRDSVEPESWELKNGGRRDAQLHSPNLSLVIRQTEPVHQRIGELLEQLRRLQDVQITFTSRLLRVPAAMGSQWQTTELLGPEELKDRLTAATSHTRTNLLMAPKVTTFNEQPATIGIDHLQLRLYGKISQDRRSIKTHVTYQNEVLNQYVQESEAIHSGNTISLYIGTEGTSSKFFDRRKLREQGVDVRESNEDHIFLLVTPTIIIQEEKEELKIGLQQDWPSDRFTSHDAVRTYPAMPKVPVDWTPVQLNWDDEAWELDFENQSATLRKVVNRQSSGNQNEKFASGNEDSQSNSRPVDDVKLKGTIIKADVFGIDWPDLGTELYAPDVFEASTPGPLKPVPPGVEVNMQRTPRGPRVNSGKP